MFDPVICSCAYVRYRMFDPVNVCMFLCVRMFTECLIQLYVLARTYVTECLIQLMCVCSCAYVCYRMFDPVNVCMFLCVRMLQNV